MTTKAAFDAFTSTRIDIGLFQRKDRHDLHRHNPMRTDSEEDDSNFSDEDYEDNDMDDQHHDHRHRPRKIILLATGILLVMILLLSWLVVVPQNKLNNYPQTDGISPVVSLLIRKTHNLTPEYYVTINYYDTHHHIQQISRLIQGDSLIVEGDIIQFPGSPTRYQLIAVTGNNSHATNEQPTIPSDNSIQPDDTDTGYLNTVQSHHWMAPTVTINTCTVILGLDSDYNSHSFTIQVSQDGTCITHQLS